jgi:hypothetical protein
VSSIEQSVQSLAGRLKTKIQAVARHSSPSIVVNLVLVAVTLALVLTSDRSVLTGLLVLAWGAGACFLAYDAGLKNRPFADGKRVVLAYLLATGLLYLLLNGAYRLLGA